jgi:hypothetical protein
VVESPVCSAAATKLPASITEQKTRIASNLSIDYPENRNTHSIYHVFIPKNMRPIVRLNVNRVIGAIANPTSSRRYK